MATLSPRGTRARVGVGGKGNSDDDMLAQAIAARAASGTELGSPDPAFGGDRSAYGYGNGGPSPGHQPYQQQWGGAPQGGPPPFGSPPPYGNNQYNPNPYAQNPYAQNPYGQYGQYGQPKPPPGPRIPGHGWNAEMIIACSMTLGDFMLQVWAAASVHTHYGVDQAEPFWAVIIVSTVVNLIGLVSFVSKANNSTDGDGVVMQQRLNQNFESTGFLLLIAAALPETLKLLTPPKAERAHQLILKLDLVRTLVSSVPFLPMALAFLYAHGWGDMFWLYGTMNATEYVYITTPCLSDLGSGFDNATFPPPPSPPPPYPPYDPTKLTSYVMVTGFAVSCVTIVLKIIRIMVVMYIKKHTLELHQRVAAAEGQLAAEQEELNYYRQQYNDQGGEGGDLTIGDGGGDLPLEGGLQNQASQFY